MSIRAKTFLLLPNVQKEPIYCHKFIMTITSFTDNSFYFKAIVLCYWYIQTSSFLLSLFTNTSRHLPVYYQECFYFQSKCSALLIHRDTCLLSLFVFMSQLLKHRGLNGAELENTFLFLSAASIHSCLQIKDLGSAKIHDILVPQASWYPIIHPFW